MMCRAGEQKEEQGMQLRRDANQGGGPTVIQDLLGNGSPREDLLMLAPQSGPLSRPRSELLLSPQQGTGIGESVWWAHLRTR